MRGLRWRSLSKRIDRPYLTESRIAVILVAVGLLLRMRQYLFDRSLWFDEATMANTIVGHSVGDLLTLPLSDEIVAPLGFLALTKHMFLLFGNMDWAIRIIPLASGVVAVLMGSFLGRSVFATPLARLVFLSLLSFSPILIFYSTELHPYSTDVAVCLFILWVGMNFQKWKLGLIIWALLGCAAVWISFPSVFVLAGTGSVMMLLAMRKKEYKLFLYIAGISILWLASFLPAYLWSRNALMPTNVLWNIWKIGFAPFPPTSLNDLRWYWTNGLGLVFLAFRVPAVAGIGVDPGWYDPLNLTLFTIAILGAIVLKSKRFSGFVLSIIAAAILASSFQAYPFQSRLILYLVPFVFAVVAGFIEWLEGIPYIHSRLVAAVTMVLLIGIVASPSVAFAFHPYNFSDIKGALSYIQAHREQDDRLALSGWSIPAFLFYAKAFHMERLWDGITVSTVDDIQFFRHQACQQQPRGRTWVLFSHRFNERENFLTPARELGQLLDYFEGDGAGAYLFDFSNLAC